MGPYLDIDRADWAPLASWDTRPLTAPEAAALGGIIEEFSLHEVEQVYLPLARLTRIRMDATHALTRAQASFLGLRPRRVPFLVGLAGSVAVGKSTTARVLQALLSRGRPGLQVALVTTDGFLHPNAELERRGLLDRKGYPESYDQRALLRFVADLKSGADEVSCPIYSHHAYDVTAERLTLRAPDVAILEGLNVLQTGLGTGFVSDYFDFTIYVDADERDLQAWYVSRFQRLRQTAFRDPAAYFHRFAGLTEAQAEATALGFWTGINLPNLRENIVQTRERADLVLEKGPDHAIRRVRLRNA